MTRPRLSALLFATMLIFCISRSALCSEAESYPFTAGSSRLSLFFGNTTAFNRNYSVFGLGVGYFVADGIEVGVDAENWSGNTPRIEQVSPLVQFVLNTPTELKPYLGAFYRRTFIEGYRDTETAGGRAGLYWILGTNAYFGAGLAQEVHLNCDRTIYSSCAETYPEITFAILFR